MLGPGEPTMDAMVTIRDSRSIDSLTWALVIVVVGL